MCFLRKIFKCQCGCNKEVAKSEGQCGCKCGKKAMLVLAMLLVSVIVIVSLLREKIVSVNQDQTTIYGQGKVSYAPDMATINLGVQVDKAVSAEEAMKQMNDKIAKIIEAVKVEGVKETDIQTNNFSLFPQYDYTDGKSRVSGYNANQQLAIKVQGVDKNKEISGKVISAANNAGANQIIGVSFSVSNVIALKQKARVNAIKDARSKSKALFEAAGMRNQKIVGWYENIIQSPDTPIYANGYGMGGSEMSSVKIAPSAQVPSGTQEIILEIGVIYKER